MRSWRVIKIICCYPNSNQYHLLNHKNKDSHLMRWENSKLKTFFFNSSSSNFFDLITILIVCTISDGTAVFGIVSHHSLDSASTNMEILTRKKNFSLFNGSEAVWKKKCWFRKSSCACLMLSNDSHFVWHVTE